MTFFLLWNKEHLGSKQLDQILIIIIVMRIETKNQYYIIIIIDCSCIAAIICKCFLHNQCTKVFTGRPTPTIINTNCIIIFIYKA